MSEKDIYLIIELVSDGNNIIKANSNRNITSKFSHSAATGAKWLREKPILYYIVESRLN